MHTWHDVPDLNALVGVSEAIGYTDVDHGRLLCVAYRAPSGVACSFDKGATWTARYTGTAGAATAVVAWPTASPERLVWVDSNGLLISEDDGETWWSGPVPGGEAPLKLVLADDDTILLDTRSGRAALILTHDGPYLLRGGQSDAPTLDRFSGYSRVDDASGFMECTGCVEVPHRDDAGLDSVVQVPADGLATLGLRGTRIVVWGEPITGGEARVVVDGIERAPGAGVRARGGPGRTGRSLRCCGCDGGGGLAEDPLRP